MAIPFLGRLSLGDWQRIVITGFLLVMELALRFTLRIWWALKLPFDMPLFLSLSKRLNSLIPLKRWDRVTAEPSKDHSLTHLQHTVEMGAFWGYQVEEHATVTKDGYVLVLHRLGNKQGKPVLMWHGFMMNSQIWLAHPQRENNLALVLADLGYDVWLANVRGNKYSHKHLTLSPTTKEFWDFSIDHHAMFDLPVVVDYILSNTERESLSYVGFSQGTTIGFAALSILPRLRQKINLFIALSPSMKPYGLTNSFVASAVRASPELIYLIFGRRALLPSVHFYQSVVPPSVFVSLIDTAVSVLFHWKSDNMSFETKITAYQHLYSLCSVKLMVHWFQIIREGRFQMYDEVGKIFQGPFFSKIRGRSSSVGQTDFMLFGLPNDLMQQRVLRKSGSKEPIKSISAAVSHVPTRFPSEQLRHVEDEKLKRTTDSPPIALFYGGSDTLLDMPSLLDGLRFPMEQIIIPDKVGVESVTLFDIDKPKFKLSDDSPVVFLKCVPLYEHLCFLWGDKMPKECHSDITRLLQKYSK